MTHAEPNNSNLTTMNWYYADNGERKGPLTEYDFTSLARSGGIKADTLIWREGMPDWQPLSQARPDLVIASGAPSIGGLVVPEQQKDLVVQQMREGVLPANFATQAPNPYGFIYAGFWIRFAAKFIDLILMTIVNYALMFLMLGSVAGFGGMMGGDPEFQRKMQNDPTASFAFLGMMLLYYVVVLGIHVAYNGLLTWKYGGTLGKLAVGLKVVRADGLPLTLGRSIGRAFADLLNSFACSLTYLMVAFDEPEKRALQDHICGTRVVQK